MKEVKILWGVVKPPEDERGTSWWTIVDVLDPVSPLNAYMHKTKEEAIAYAQEQGWTVLSVEDKPNMP